MNGQPREHGTRACYVWGPDPGPGKGCRCDACTEANRAEHQRTGRLRLYGQWEPFVPAGPVREHLGTLSRAGIGRRRVAALSGVSETAVCQILHGKPGRPPVRGVRRETAAAILAVQPRAGALAPSAHVDAAGTRRRLQALVAIGWSQSQLADRLGMLPGNFGQVMRRGQVTVATAGAVRDLYDRLWDKPPAEGTHREKIAASRARNHARARGWVLPLGWDDSPEDGHGIDDPAAVPAEGWRRRDGGRPRRADTAEDGTWLIRTQGYTRTQAAERLGVSKDVLEHSLAQATRASDHHHEEVLTMAAEPARNGTEAAPEPGTPHPDQRLAARGWHACEHGVWTRHPDGQMEAEKEAG